MEENELHGPGQRYLVLTRKFNFINFKQTMTDIFSTLTPDIKLSSTLIGHKSKKRIIYRATSQTSFEERLKIIFG